MYKLTLLLLLFLKLNLHAEAQNKEAILLNFKTLLKESVTDFKNLQEQLLEADSAKNTFYYKCLTSLGSSFEAIAVNNNDSTVYFTSSFDYSLTNELIKATEILPGLLDIVNAMIKTGKYTGRDYVNNKQEKVTEIKDLNGNYIIDIESDGDNRYLRITIYGKSWGKK